MTEPQKAPLELAPRSISGTGMPFWEIVCAFCSEEERWMMRPPRFVRPLRGTVTWTGPGRGRSISQSSAAERWLRMAPFPQARTAANHLPSLLNPACPQA
jgi:hypothetical protein